MTNNYEKFIANIVAGLSMQTLFHKDIDVPFLVAPIWQMLNEDLIREPDLIADINSGDYAVKMYYNEDTNAPFVVVTGSHEYKIEFTSDPEYKGYCQCTPDMDGYREDKQCCGHDCDWDVPKVIIHKDNKGVLMYRWNGDQSSYWKFEDLFIKRKNKGE